VASFRAFITVTAIDLFSRPSLLTIIPWWTEQLLFTNSSEEPLFHRLSHTVAQLTELNVLITFTEAANNCHAALGIASGGEHDDEWCWGSPTSHISFQVRL
jgi:hypothetical protein